jgi:hypothetical protein
MPNKLLVSLEIAWDNSETYDRIYQATNAAIREGLTNEQWWAETTSFYVVEVNENSAQFTERVVTAGRLRSSKDMLVVINMNGEGGRAWGALQDSSTLKRLLPFVQKV